MLIIDCCPYCKSTNYSLVHRGAHLPWHCNDCDALFDEDDYQHQLYWENISCLLNGTSIEEPMVFEDGYILPSVEEESQGLSEAEKLHIDKVHQIEGDGKMYYHFAHTPDTDEYWLDMYELPTEDLRGLLEFLRLNC